MIDWEGEPTRLCTCIDITERKMAEEAIRERETQVRLIVDNVPVLIAYVDRTRHLRFINQTLERWLGMTPEKALHQHVQEVLGESAYLTVNSYIDEVLEGRAVSFELEMPYANGNRYVNSRYVPHVDDREVVQGFFALIVDLTEVKRLEAQLLQTQKMEAIGTFASGIAHEFNNILNVVMAYIGLAESELPLGSPAQSHLAEVDIALERAKDLLKQMLTFSRQAATAYEPLDFTLLVQDALRFFRVSISKNIHIRQYIAEESLTVMADSTQLHQILMNLFANAEYVMRDTGGCLEVRLETLDIAADDMAVTPDLPPGSYVHLSVRDTGAGIPLEVQEHIFEPFFTTKSVGEGTGMGLAIVHGIVTSHGGMITADSEPGEGAVFAI